MSLRTPSLSPRRRTILTAAMAVALVVGVAVGRWLPDAGLRWGVIEALRTAGMAEVALGAADLSLFDGKVVVRKVSARAGAANPFDLAGALMDFRWRPLLSKRVSLRSLDLDGARLDVRRQGESWVINGLPLPSAESGGGTWTFGADSLRLTASRLTVSDGGVTVVVDIDELVLGAVRSWEPEAAVEWRLTGRANGAAVAVEGTATPLAVSPFFAVTLAVDDLDLAAVAAPAERAGLSGAAGRLSARLALSNRDGAPTAKGSLTLAKPSATLAGTTVAATQLGWSGTMAWRDGATLDGTLLATGLRVATADGTVDIDRAEWRGAARAAADTPPRADGTLDVAGLVGRLGDHRVDHARAGAKGILTLLPATAAAGVMPPLAGAADLWVEGLLVTEPASGRTVAAAERVDAVGVAFSPSEGGRLERLAATGLAAKDGRVRIGRAGAERAAMTPAGDLSLDTLSLAAVAARLVRTADGFEGFPSPGVGDGGTLPRIAIGRATVAGARVDFEDRTPSEPVRLAVDQADLAVHDLDTGQPYRDSRFRFTARAQGAQVAARGTLRPFAPSLSGSVRGKVGALDLPALSPYAADTLGVHLHTGQLAGDLAVTIEEGALDGRMDVVLSKLFVAQPDPKAPLAVQADMPVATVLDLLRDAEQRIRLTIPVRGDLGQPDFDVSDAVSQAVGGALKATVVTTLKVAFPVVALVGFVIDEASTPRLSLQPLDFMAGEHRLAPPHLDRLATVAALLHQRPGVRLNLCGVATAAADWPVLAERRRHDQSDLLAKLRAMVGRSATPAGDTPDRDALAELADRRAQTVKAWLMESGGVDPGRLFVCRPTVGEAADGGPRVDLLI